ncbi:hypothetical protein [Bartonella senegalensis]|uniref:hypothetical protein n=1 Tax=Bartonella senegalensis TaxID=1468418 RepID=UPI0002DA0BD5|nr:hypothetical protein [Bartonella senegalensis]
MPHKDEDSAFGIYFPRFKRFFSVADKEENFITNAIETLQLYCEEMAILPTALEFEKIIEQKAIKAAFLEGHFFETDVFY